MGEVSDLFATLGLRIDQGAWRQGDARIAGLRTAVDRLGGMESRKAADGLKAIGGAASAAAEKGAQGFDRMGQAIKGVAVYFAGKELYHALIGFNEAAQTARIGLSAMIQGNLGGSWDQAKKSAQGLYDEFQRFSVMAPVTTRDIMTFGKEVAVATFQAGGSLKDLTTITEQGVIAAKAFGYESSYASLELTEMLQGNVSNRMRFVKQLLGMVHVTEEEFRTFSAKQRLELTKKILTSPALKNAADEFKDSFAGVTSTLEDRLQILFGRVGMPLFKALTEAVAGLNAWLERNKETIEAVGVAIGSVLATAFDVLKTAINGVVVVLGFLVEHAEMTKAILIALAIYFTIAGVQAAWAARRAAIAWLAAAGPFVAIIAAIAAIVYAIRYLITQSEGVRDAFASAWQSIKDGLEVVKDAFRAAFEWIGDLPVIKQLIWLVQKLGSILTPNAAHEGLSQEQINALPDSELNDNERYLRLIAPLVNPDQDIINSMAPTRSGEGDVSINVHMGDIKVNAPNADANEVAIATRRVFAEELGNVLRRTRDVMG